MKKILIALLCCTMLGVMVSCTKNNDVTLEVSNDPPNFESTDKQELENTRNNNVNFEKYIGTWYDDFIPPNELEIISKDTEKIECRLGIYRLTTFHLIITAGDEEFSFVDKYNLISGKIDFKDNSVLVTIEESNTEYIQCGANYLFTIKD